MKAIKRRVSLYKCHQKFYNGFIVSMREAIIKNLGHNKSNVSDNNKSEEDGQNSRPKQEMQAIIYQAKKGLVNYKLGP